MRVEFWFSGVTHPGYRDPARRSEMELMGIGFRNEISAFTLARSFVALKVPPREGRTTNNKNPTAFGNTSRDLKADKGDDMATSPVSSLSNSVFTNFLPAFSWTETSVQIHRKPEPEPAVSESAAPAIAEADARREQVLLEHLPLVRFVARRIHERLPQHIELEDLVSAGVVGLIDAYSKFDSKKNVQFRSYAQFRIRGAILDGMRTLDWGSRDLRRKGRNIEEAIETLTHRLNRKPAENEVADELGMPLARYQELLGDLKGLQVGSLQETRDDDTDDEELAYLASPAEEDPFHRCMQRERAAQLEAALQQLPERDARVLSLYYGKEMTLKEIGATLGLVESRVSQIRTAAVANLRAQLNGARSSRRAHSGTSRLAGGQAGQNRRPNVVPMAPVRRHATPARSYQPIGCAL